MAITAAEARKQAIQSLTGQIPAPTTGRITADEARKQAFSSFFPADGGKKKTKGTGKIFSGGAFSDVLDVLQVPQFAATGLLSPEVTLKEAVSQRVAPSDLLFKEFDREGKNFGQKAGNVAKRLATDVILDPLNLIGIGAVTKVGRGLQKSGQLAGTVADQARLGQRTLLGLDIPFAGGAIPLPVPGGRQILGATTKLAEAGRRLPGVDTALGALNFGTKISKAPTPRGELLRKAKTVKQAKLAARGVEQALAQPMVRIAQLLKKESDKLVKRGLITADDLGDIVEKVANPKSNIVIKPELTNIFTKFQSNVDEMNKIFRRFGGAQLEGKVLKNVLLKDSKEAMESLKTFQGQFREVAGKAGSEQFAGKANFVNLAGRTKFGQAKTPTRINLADGSKLKKFKLGDETAFVTNKAFERMKKAKIRARGQALDAIEEGTLKRADEAKFVRGKVEEAFQALKRTRPDEVFRRVAATPRQANIALDSLDELARFSEDPAVILAAQGRDVAKLQARNAFIENVKDIGQKWPRNKKVPEGFARSTIEGLDEFVFEDVLVEHMDATHKAFSSIDAVNKFAAGYDRLHNFIKSNLTFINPAFHTRNAVSNMWQLFLAGMNPANVKQQARGFLAENAARKAFKQGKSIDNFLKGDDLKYYREFTSGVPGQPATGQGLRSTGRSSVDIDGEISNFQQLPGVKQVYEAGGATGEFLENGAKFSLYAFLRDKGMAPKAAAFEVRKYLFDYSDLTPFEQNIMKRAMPFYSWTRKNLPLQVAMLIQKPTKASIIAKAKAAIEDTNGGSSLEDRMMPAWLREAYPIYFGEDKNGLERFFKAEGYLPTVDVGQLFRPLEIPFEGLSPLAKTPMELVSNYDFFLEREIKQFEGEKVRFLGQNVKPATAKVLRLARPLSEINKLVVDKGKERQPSLLDRWVNVMIGKTYQIDPERQAEIYDFLLTKEYGKVKKALEQAERRGDAEMVKDLNRHLKALENGSGFEI